MFKISVHRLDQILGRQGSKARDVYVSKISLASRVVKVERQVDDIENKLDQLIELYMEDRKRLLSLPMVESCSKVPQSPIVESDAAVTVLKPILVDKQLSEPSSPTSKAIRDGKPLKPRQIHRGHSDLGSRVKKRVTLSSITPQLVHVDESSMLRPVTTYTSNTLSPKDDGVVIIVPTLLETRDELSASTLNGRYDKSTVTVECDPGRSTGSEYNTENEGEDTSCERAALLGSASESALTILPSDIDDPGGSMDQP